jgi:hypothetical protein
MFIETPQPEPITLAFHFHILSGGQLDRDRSVALESLDPVGISRPTQQGSTIYQQSGAWMLI